MKLLSECLQCKIEGVIMTQDTVRELRAAITSARFWSELTRETQRASLLAIIDTLEAAWKERDDAIKERRP